jgi:extracellular factor (EF) 3-hydroxypalmitic acid methyl ester biosynthesis protein
MDNSGVKESLINFQTNQGMELRASLLRLTRYLAVFEIYNPACVLQTSEVLNEFKILLKDRTVYSGKAIIRNLVNTGLVVVCEAALDDSWLDVDFAAGTQGIRLSEDLRNFIDEWQKFYKVLPEYKVIVADMQMFFMELRLWLDQVELGIRAAPSGDRLKLEQDVIDELGKPIVPAIDTLFEKFERVAEKLEADALPAHRNYMKRQLHALMLCSPFAYRTFSKPLGYAGDYEMVNMILRDPYEGSTLFAKIVNLWFIKQPPAEAHRNRIDYLQGKLISEAARVAAKGRVARIFNLGCGPAGEVQRFLADEPVCNQTHFTLLDLNDETIQHVRSVLERVKSKHNRTTPVQYLKKSVHHLLKESKRSIDYPVDSQYDFVYCAGLFDYLPDQVCQRLMTVLYNWLAPGGLLMATNVDACNPLRNGMEHLLDWYLVYRTGQTVWALKPDDAPADAVSVKSDITGVNLFIEIRKPENVKRSTNQSA